MIHETHGDLLTADVEAVVNTVNTVGVMGKGIALQFKRRYPANFKAYAAASKADRVNLGKMFVFDTGRLSNPRWIINFPTKRHWKSRSKLSDIESGLDDLSIVVRDLGIRSIAVPPLGCGLGGLDWSDVRPLIETKLADLDAKVLVFPPEGPPPAPSIAPDGTRPAMSPGKAALVNIVDRYGAGPLGISQIEIQKLMYFLQTAGQPLRLEFTKGIYGPYADNLRHVLNRVEGHFLNGFGDGTSPVLEAEPIILLPGAAEEASIVVAADPELLSRIDQVLELSDGFESPYGMELLATVHWAATAENCCDTTSLVDTVHSWNTRKKQMFTTDHLSTAIDHLVREGWLDSDVFAGCTSIQR